MSYALAWSKAARRSLERLPANLQQRIAAAVSALAGEPRPDGVAPVRSQPGCLRLRVGDWRVLYRVDDGLRSVLVIQIMPRQDDYRP